MTSEETQELGREGLEALGSGETFPPRPGAWDSSDTPEGKQTYIVQQLDLGSRPDADLEAGSVWVDVARQHFPMKTQVKTVLIAVVADLLGDEPTRDDRYRILDAAGNGRERSMRPKPRETPEYEVA